jgi:hypothetical protein
MTIGMVNFDINSHFSVPSTCTPSFRATFCASKALLRTCFLPLQMTSLTSQTEDFRLLR